VIAGAAAPVAPAIVPAPAVSIPADRPNGAGLTPIGTVIAFTFRV
jgi:hypothetical protein